ncbi:MAG TPA: rRNA maturation RNase YbeY [Vicinamibacterales bacterium]|nr:rRNA maturation RNase YbeY [Vicinamibacterales bacterium]HPW20949.1 rRNA maturation RNase YbeY [Vicinamibacterales bacterium]
MSARSGSAPGRRGVRVTVASRMRRPVRAPGLAAWLASAAPAFARGEVVVAFVSDAHIRDLNRRYRGKDAVTDVLAFPSDEPGLLGDIAIAAGAARRQAAAAGHAFGVEARVLALHGLLHLLGYDHERDSDRDRMRAVESRLRRKGGLREGLIEREGGAP